MQFKSLFISLAAMALVQATPVASLEAKAALENRQGACITGKCMTCVQHCMETYGGPDRTSSLQRSGCSFACLASCNDCN
ncbi:hypothetical protein QBC35DRAFT_97400 [Podospora australis]|uniref:Uncharacterized protein n=1 Tax=Podospora australis TaxID=1536484 RepID=A0AAN6WKC8_9PEZI|nr:hypothetical protein QBC35DRAFT_97400 [Podospora australis]